MPVAFVPLWQLEQLPVMPVWLKPVAGFQAVVLWQLLHSAVVAMWVGGLPVAVVPLWQLEQVPITCAWSTRVAGFQAVVAWQVSHAVGREDVRRRSCRSPSRRRGSSRSSW